MRAASIALILSLAGGGYAVAQALPPSAAGSFQNQMDLQLQLNAIQAQQDLAQRQAVIRDTQAAALEAQLRAQQAYADVRAQSVTPRLPAALSGAPPADIDVRGLASIPDAALAESDARVRAAAKNRR